jgi:hypothetical protein
MTTTCRASRADSEPCGARTDGLLCTQHLGQIRRALEALPELLAELDVTISRQDRGTAAPLYAMNRAKIQQPGVHYDEGDTTLPSTQWAFSWDAANVRWNIDNTVSTWARIVAETLKVATPADAAAFLLDHLDDIRGHEAAPELWDEIRACERDAQRAIDRQEPDLFAGRCEAMVMTMFTVDDTLIPELSPCGTDLMARTGDDDVKCPACGAVYDLVTQQRMLDAARPDALGTPSVIAGALSTEDRQLDRVTLNRWIERDARQTERTKEGPTCVECTHRTCEGIRAADLQAIMKRHGRPLIPRRGWDSEGRSVYRAGDVEARIAWNETQRSGRVAG